MLSVPLTVLLRYEIVTNNHLLATATATPATPYSTNCRGFSAGSTSTGSTSHQPVWSTNLYVEIGIVEQCHTV